MKTVLMISLETLIWKYRDVWYYSDHLDVPLEEEEYSDRLRFPIGFLIFQIQPDLNVQFICASHQYRK